MTTTTEERSQSAREYVASGLSLVPIEAGAKKPVSAWLAYQSKRPGRGEPYPTWAIYQARRPTDEEIVRWVNAYPGLGIVGGKVSGNHNGDGEVVDALEILDLESIAPLDEFRQLVEEAAPGLIERLPRTKTPSGGRHIFYRCETVEGNQKLAERAEEAADADLPRTDGGALDKEAIKKLGLRLINGKYFKIRTLIETRGEGGQVLSPLCLPGTHPSGGVYELINGDLRQIPTITATERDILLTAARACNEFVEPTKAKGHREADREKIEGLKPGADYNARSDVFTKMIDLLKEYGWTVWKDQSAGPLLSRPGVDDHCSARLASSGALRVFSSNADPFGVNETYTPFAVYTELKHNGDFKAAAKALAEQGYGDQGKSSKKKSDKKSEGGEAEAGRQTQADMLIEIAKGVDLCHSIEEDLGYAHISVNGHQETHRIHSKAFRQYLMREFYQQHEKIPNAEATQNALTYLDGRARFDSPATDVHLRLALHDGRIYWDLANDGWQILEISSGGWRLIEAKDAPIRFRRSKGMLRLPAPVKGGDLARLKDFINYPDHAAWSLHATWLIAALRANARNFPILILNGEQGSAKSTASKMTRGLLDPNVADLRPKPREDRDLYIAARNGWVCAFDNLSGLPREFSDALCRLATGAGFGTRELYENDEETLFNAARPIIVNGIDDLAEKADLIDRGVFIELPPILDEERKDEETLWADFEKERPKLIGALADAVAAALKNLPNVKLAKLPRMADFAKWGAAASVGGDQTFLNAYTGNRTQANDLAIRANDVAAYVAEWYESQEAKTVTLGDLLGALTGLVRAKLAQLQNCKPEKVKLPAGWPTTERKLGNELRRCAPNLRRAGIEVLDAGLDTRTRKAQRTFQRYDQNGAVSDPSHSSQASHPSQSAESTEDELRRNVRRFDRADPAETFANANCEGLSDTAEPKPSHIPSQVKPQNGNGLGDAAKVAKDAKVSTPTHSGTPDEEAPKPEKRRRVSL